MINEKKTYVILFLTIIIFSPLIPMSSTMDDNIKFVEASPSQNWWDSNWQYRREIKITNNLDEIIYNFQVLLELTSDDYIGKVQSDGKDIRIVAADPVAELNFWIETWNDQVGQTNKIWVMMPVLEALGNDFIYLYYGNTNPEIESSSDGLTTFIAFDDFNDYSQNEEPRYNRGWESVGNYALPHAIVDTERGGMKMYLDNPGGVRTIFANRWIDVGTVTICFDWNVEIGSGYFLAYDDGNVLPYTWFYSNQLQYYDPPYKSYNSPLYHSYNTWHKMKYNIWNNDHSVAIDDETHNTDGSGNYHTFIDGADYFSFYTYTTGSSHKYNVDNFYVRKHLSQEPSIFYNIEESIDPSYGDYIIDEALLQYYGLIGGENPIHENYNGEGITILMIDTAVDYRNEYFWDSEDDCRIKLRALFRDHNTMPYNPIAENDNGGFEEITHDLENMDYEFLNNDFGFDIIMNSNYDHGTYVAGIIRQIAPKANIISVGIIKDEMNPEDFCQLVGATNALDWVWNRIDDGTISPDIVTMSMGASTARLEQIINKYPTFDINEFKPFISNLANHDIMFTIAAGNVPLDLTYDPLINETGKIFYPARFEADASQDEMYPGFIPVAAINYNNEFGCYVERFVYDYYEEGDIDIAAYGAGLTTTACRYSNVDFQNGWETINTAPLVGTSFATPIVAGTLALLKQYFLEKVTPYYSFNPELTEAIIFRTAVPGADNDMDDNPLNPPLYNNYGDSNYYGHGCLNIKNIFIDSDEDGFVDCLEEIIESNPSEINDPVPQSAPTYQDVFADKLTVNWIPVADAYFYELNKNGLYFGQYLDPQTQLTISELKPGTNYAFKYKAIFIGRESEFSPESIITTQDLNEPSEFNGQAFGSTIIILSWKKPTNVMSSTNELSYRIKWLVDGSYVDLPGAFYILHVGSLSDNQYFTVTDLSPSTTYFFKIYAKKNGVYSPDFAFWYGTTGSGGYGWADPISNYTLEINPKFVVANSLLLAFSIIGISAFLSLYTVYLRKKLMFNK